MNETYIDGQEISPSNSVKVSDNIVPQNDNLITDKNNGDITGETRGLKGLFSRIKNFGKKNNSESVDKIKNDNRTFYSKDLSDIEKEIEAPQKYKEISETGGDVQEEFDYEKVKQLANDLKQGKHNPLKYKGKTIKIDNVESSEKDYVISEITSNMSDYEKETGFATRRLYSKTDKKDYIYNLIYDKDGMHNITKYEVTDNDVFN